LWLALSGNQAAPAPAAGDFPLDGFSLLPSGAEALPGPGECLPIGRLRFFCVIDVFVQAAFFVATLVARPWRAANAGFAPLLHKTLAFGACVPFSALFTVAANKRAGGCVAGLEGSVLHGFFPAVEGSLLRIRAMSAFVLRFPRPASIVLRSSYERCLWLLAGFLAACVVLSGSPHMQLKKMEVSCKYATGILCKSKFQLASLHWNLFLQ